MPNPVVDEFVAREAKRVREQRVQMVVGLLAAIAVMAFYAKCCLTSGPKETAQTLHVIDPMEAQ